MADGVCTVDVSGNTCFDCCSSYFKDPVQDSLNAPMPWIGMYIAAASVVCWGAVLLDCYNGFYRKKFWFPCKFFSLNSFTLTVIAVAMKLSVDLTDMMIGRSDKLARATSLVFMTTAMANFMTSLGSMENNEILINLVSLGILVITIAVNVCIRNVQLNSVTLIFEYGLLFEEYICNVVMILMFVTLCFLSIMVPTIKKLIESAYQKVERISVSNMKVEWGSFNIDELKTVVTRYWVMAQTGSPQFVIARSAICVIPGVVSLLMSTLTLLQVVSQLSFLYNFFGEGTGSIYKGSILKILISQSVFVAFSNIAPVFRWYTAAQLKSLHIGHKTLKDEFKVEAYWTQMLLDWKNSPLPSIIRRLIGKKLAHNARRLILNFCFGVQVVIVLISKLLLFISATCVKIISFYSYFFFKESRDATQQDISRYVVLLEGEGELPEKTLRNLCKEVDWLTGMGRKKQPKYLNELLEKSENFNGVIEFDSKQISSLHSHEEPPYSWSLAIVTLASIAIALPNVMADKCDALLRGVSKGLYFAKVIEKALDRSGELASIRNAADVIWARVELNRKWQHIDIREINRKSGSYKDVLQKFSDVARRKITDFIMENPLSWPTEVVSANAMYRVSKTIMQASKDNNCQTEEELFERLSNMISDILSACLTNLGRVIALNCHSNVIEKREESVRQAALLLGESEEILKILQKRLLPGLDEEKAAYIDEWRMFLEQNSENPATYVPEATTMFSNSDGEHVIEVES